MVRSSSEEQQPLLRSDRAVNRDWDAIFGESHFVAKLLATSWNYFVSGIAVTALGALIPSLETHYGIADGTVAAIFPCVVGGYLCSTASIHFVHVQAGRRGLGFVSSFFRLSAFIALSLAPHFSLCLFAYCILGFGTGLTDSGWSAWGAGLNYPSVVQGPLHGSFGVGCIVGPVVAVSIITHGYGWMGMYELLLSFSAVEILVQLWAFWHDDGQAYRNASPRISPLETDEAPHIISEEDAIENIDQNVTTSSSLNPRLYRGTWMCALFFFVYVSIEFTYSDWIVVFMRRARDLPYTTAGLASSIFWLGMSIGRMSLGPLAEYLGVKRSIAMYLACSTVVQLVFRAVHQPALSLVLLSINGFWIGPTFPSGLVLLSRAVPASVQVSAISLACAMGQIGGASIPFIIGLMAEKIGIGHMLDVVLGMTVALIIVWAIFCRAS